MLDPSHVCRSTILMTVVDCCSGPDPDGIVHSVSGTSSPTLLAQAASFAISCHSGQFRKGSSVPYISHLFCVAGLALEFGADEDEAIAALLHDAVEDAGGRDRLIEIERMFGPRVAEIVAGCTDTDLVPKPPWRPRKEAFLTRLRSASRSVRLVVACDKLHNVQTLLRDVRSVGLATLERFSGGAIGTAWYYQSVADIVSAEPLLADGLSPAVALPTALTRELQAAAAELSERVRTSTAGPAESLVVAPRP
jgi:(p)ppGpp synthase/HD superfamily hydrolase